MIDKRLIDVKGLSFFGQPLVFLLKPAVNKVSSLRDFIVRV